MKRYLLFYGDIYYPSGGMRDFEGDFDTFEESQEKYNEWLRKSQPHNHWAHIYDLLTMEIIWRE